MSDLLLCIDTAGSRCAVAVYDMAGRAMLARAEPDIGRGHAERLLPLVADVMAEAGVGYRDLARLAVVVGPGSFTGLRVGVAAAKGLALALGIEAAGVSTLEALAEPHWGGGVPVLSVIDAKRGEVYAALFAPGGTLMREPEALSPDGLLAFVASAGGQAVLLVGTGCDIAAVMLGAKALRSEGPPSDIASLARIGASRRPAGPLKPLYLRGADAKPPVATGVSHVTGQETLP